MKKLFIFAALVLGMASCQKDVNSLEVNVGEQETVVTVSLPEVTRANSANSGWENTEGTLRVIMQIFDENGNTTDAMRFDQETISFNAKRIVNYNVRLVPGHQYTFVAWADQGDQYFNVDNLKNVTFVDGAWTAMNEGIDAYTATKTVEKGQSVRNIDLTLTRPFAKVRVVATDIQAIRNLGWEPTSAVATYQETVPVSFNAFAGVVGETAPVENPDRHVSYNNQYDDATGKSEMTLFADYLYVPTSGTAKFEFAINGRDNHGNDIVIRNDIAFNTPIPAVRNMLTTIKGNILTDGSNIKVEVDEEFEQPGNEIEVVEIPVTTAAELIAALANSNAEIILQNDIVLNDILVINTPETRAASTLPGRNITIDGNGKTLTSSAARAINVSGINGVTIKNLNIVASGERAINIINNATNVTIDNVTATAANYTVNVAASAPNAVVAIKNSTLNGLCTVNVASAGSNVTVDGSTVNCNDNDTTAGESYAALCLNKAAVGAKIIATNSTINVTEGSDSTKGRNGAEDGEVTINGGVEGVVVTKAVITYPGSDYYYGFETIQEAVEFAKAGETVGLIRDVTTTETISLDKNITIDLNGKTLSTNSTKKVITIENNGATSMSVNIKNGEIINNANAGRCVDTRSGNINLTLDGVTLTATTGAYTQPLTIGGSGDNINVNVKNSTITAGHYAIITFNPAVITLDNTVLNGYTPVYFKPATGSLGSNGTIFNVTNGSVIKCVNEGTDTQSETSAFQFADTGVSVSIDATSTIKVVAEKNVQTFFRFGNSVDTQNVLVGTVTIADDAQLISSGDKFEGILGIYQQSAKPKFSANMAQTLENEGWVVSEAVDGLVTVTGKK